MKQVKYIVNLIIIPLASLIFLAAGASAAFVSALIEYSVVKGFFTSIYQELIASGVIAFLLVFSLEITKLFLHFVQKKQKNEPKLSVGFTRTLMILLVSFSFFCSMVFTVTTLYLPRYDMEAVEEEVMHIEEQLALDIVDAKAEYEAEYDKNIAPFLEAKESADAACLEPVPDGYGPKKTAEYMQKRKESAEEATQLYVEAMEKFSAVKEKKVEAAVQQLNKEAAERKNALMSTDTPQVAAQYDNPILSHFLTVLSNIIFQAANYSRQAYLWLCILMSIALSAMLEAIISISLQFLAIPMDFLVEDMGHVNDKIRKWCHECVVTLFKAFGAVTIYITILSASSESMEREKICLGLAACTLSIFLINKVLPLPENKPEKVWLQFFYQIRDCILQGVVSLMGFVLLGFLFGNDALQMDVNTIAVGIGSTLSGGLIQIPKFLIANEIIGAGHGNE